MNISEEKIKGFLVLDSFYGNCALFRVTSVFFCSYKMPHYCIVPKCKNRSGTRGISFYRLPLKHPSVLKLWIIRIRRKNPPINKSSRVCSAHFEGGKRKGRKDVPSVFAWTKNKVKRPPPKRRRIESDPSEVEDEAEIPDQEGCYIILVGVFIKFYCFRYGAVL